MVKTSDLTLTGPFRCHASCSHASTGQRAEGMSAVALAMRQRLNLWFIDEGSKSSSSSFEFELARSPPKIFFHVSVE